MNKYMVNIDYQETSFYSYGKEIEAESEREARMKGWDDLMQNLKDYQIYDRDGETIYSDIRLTAGVDTFYSIWNCGQSDSYEDCDNPHYTNDYDELKPALEYARRKAEEYYKNEQYNYLFCVCECKRIIEDSKEKSRIYRPIANIRSLSYPIRCCYIEQMIGE